MDNTIVPTEVTLTMTNTEEMVNFYKTVLMVDLQPYSLYGTTLYRGVLHGLQFILCPNTLVGVEADQSRHRFTYQVADLDAILERAAATGASVREETPPTGYTRSATIFDPDGNQIYFVQAGSAAP